MHAQRLINPMLAVDLISSSAVRVCLFAGLFFRFFAHVLRKMYCALQRKVAGSFEPEETTRLKTKERKENAGI